MSSYDDKAIKGEQLQRLTEKEIYDRLKGSVPEAIAAFLCSQAERIKALESALAERNLGDVVADVLDAQTLKAGGVEVKTRQSAKTNPTASGSAISFVDSVTQNENGEMTATRKSVRSATTSQTGVVQLTDSHSSNSTTTAATPKNVKETYDLASGKQDALPTNGTASSTYAINVSGNAATAKTVSNVSSQNATNIEIDPTNGVKVGSSNNPLVTKMTSGGFESRSSVSGTTKTTAINSDGVIVSSGSDSVSMSSSGFTGPLTGNVTGNVNGSAARLANTSAVGNTSTPVYFTANGFPAICNEVEANHSTSADVLVVPAQLGSDIRPVYFTGTGAPALCGGRFLYSCDSIGSPITTQYRVCVGSVCSANNSISIV